MKTYRRAKEAVNQIIEAFKEGTIPEAMSHQFINWNSGIPCRKWSPCNQLLVALAGFRDALLGKRWVLEKSPKLTVSGNQSALIAQR